MRLSLVEGQDFGKVLSKTPALQIWLSGQEAALLGPEERKRGCGHGIRAGEWSRAAAAGSCHQGLEAWVMPVESSCSECSAEASNK